MEELVLTVEETAKLLKVHPNTVYALRDNGKLKQLDLPGVKFLKKDIYALLKLKEEYSPYEYQKLKDKYETLKQENKELKTMITNINVNVGNMLNKVLEMRY